MVGIYKITNKYSGKSYIGQSIHCFKRFEQHTNGDSLIDNVIQIEGLENFTFEILKEVPKEELSYWEDYYIMKYDTMFPNGYNKRWNCNKEMREQISNLLKEDEDFVSLIFNNNSNKRNVRKVMAFDYEDIPELRLTTNQYLVYSYLVSISFRLKEINSNCINKQKLIIKDICEQLNISFPTWKNAIQLLLDRKLIYEWKNYYVLTERKYFIPLDLDLIKLLINFGVENNCGNIVIVYSTLCKYLEKMRGEKRECAITITHLSKLFNNNREQKTMQKYRDMFVFFEKYDLIDFEIVKVNYNGIVFDSYKIHEIRNDLPEELKEEGQIEDLL